jgi:hypothetical protein
VAVNIGEPVSVHEDGSEGEIAIHIFRKIALYIIWTIAVYIIS